MIERLCNVIYLLGFVAAVVGLYVEPDPEVALFIIIPYVFRYILTGNKHWLPFKELK
jgi:hypothetical protein